MKDIEKLIWAAGGLSSLSLRAYRALCFGCEAIMTISQTTCDVCGATKGKGKANHWLYGIRSGAAIRFDSGPAGMDIWS